MSDKPRELIESDRFATSRKRIEPDAKRMDEALRGISFFIARRPELGFQTANPSVRAIATFPFGTATPLIVFYSFNADQVCLEDVLIAATDIEG